LPSALFERFKARFGIEILDGIGSTETLHMFISNRPGQVRPGSSGVPVPGYEARILDDEERPVPAGAIGNPFVKGDSICAGYWNQWRTPSFSTTPSVNARSSGTRMETAS
jgi:benzoate-CoA ligase